MLKSCRLETNEARIYWLVKEQSCEAVSICSNKELLESNRIESTFNMAFLLCAQIVNETVIYSTSPNVDLMFGVLAVLSPPACIVRVEHAQVCDVAGMCSCSGSNVKFCYFG